MNCKQGDLAIIIRSMAGNEGKIVNCIRLLSFDEKKNIAKHPNFTSRNVWLIDKPIRHVTDDGKLFDVNGRYVEDYRLRPLPPINDDDEIHTWKENDKQLENVNES